MSQLLGLISRPLYELFQFAQFQRYKALPINTDDSGWQWIIQCSQYIFSAKTCCGFSSVQFFEPLKQNWVSRNLSDGYLKISEVSVNIKMLPEVVLIWEHNFVFLSGLWQVIFYEGLQTTHTWLYPLYCKVIDELCCECLWTLPQKLY